MKAGQLKRLLENVSDDTHIIFDVADDNIFRLPKLVEMQEYIATIGPLKKDGDINRRVAKEFQPLIFFKINTWSNDECVAFKFHRKSTPLL